MADVDGNGSPTSIDDLASVGEKEGATLGPLDDRGDVSGGDERVGGSPLVVDRRSLADPSARCGSRTPVALNRPSQAGGTLVERMKNPLPTSGPGRIRAT